MPSLSNISSAVRLPIGKKLLLIQGLLLAVITAIAAIAFHTLDEVGGAAKRVGESYSPQLDRISDVEILMFRISLEARHAMLVETAAERDETFKRIGTFREEMLGKLKTFEDQVTTQGGRERMAKIRAADVLFWKLGGEVVAKIQAGDNKAAFNQLRLELVPARDVMVSHIVEQRSWQRQLVTNAVAKAERQADQTKLTVLAVAVTGAMIAAWLSWSLAQMLQGAFKRAHSVTDRIASGNLRQDIYVRKGDEFGLLFGSIADMQSRLHGVISHVRAVALKVTMAAQLIDEANRELDRVTESHAGSVQATTGSTRRMADSVRQSVQNIDTANQLASEASTVARHGGDAVSEVVTTMRGIDDSSKRIADIVNVIDSIAFQTNILALNAAVEAARAGEQGRGFAVVASEVRSLSQRSAAAAREIKTLIGESVERVSIGSNMVNQAGQTMQRIVESVAQVKTLMSDIAEATREQREGVEVVSQAVDEIGSATEQSIAAVRRSNAASAELRQHALALEEAVAAFNLIELT